MNFETPTMEQSPEEEQQEEGGVIISVEEVSEDFNLESAAELIEDSDRIPESLKEEIVSDIRELNPWSETDEIVSEFSVSEESGELVVDIKWDKKYPGGGPRPGSDDSDGWLWKNSSLGYSLESGKSE